MLPPWPNLASSVETVVHISQRGPIRTYNLIDCFTHWAVIKPSSERLFFISLLQLDEEVLHQLELNAYGVEVSIESGQLAPW